MSESGQCTKSLRDSGSVQRQRESIGRPRASFLRNFRTGARKRLAAEPLDEMPSGRWRGKFGKSYRGSCFVSSPTNTEPR